MHEKSLLPRTKFVSTKKKRDRKKAITKKAYNQTSEPNYTGGERQPLKMRCTVGTLYVQY